MNIHWYGQSAFQITSQQGTVILIDPYGKFLGYRMPKIKADIVAVTHDHKDHNQIQFAEGDYELVNQARHYSIKGVEIQGVATFHDNVQGTKRGGNIVYVITVDGLRICHAGDLGHVLTAEQIRQIGTVDILMLPVGGGMTMNGETASQVMKQLQPAIAIPMHYRTKALGLLGRLLFDKEDKFLQAAGHPVNVIKDLMISKETLNKYQGVLTLQY
ncbi:MBL fold metallo-hydrolase [Paenibacillus sp. S150]|uniref:MBL fold metallo-hydrolase n=1 Tax=Paenibacillus sp. S150 TaxID=2749826 RepID=UPI001C57B340|nr:MBL fold metallo-hydrolase [Paenibacillus sp. S150]MBW4080487.1 MBL fold metallo-hydrolase [Paenibacillus sp. S150]